VILTILRTYKSSNGDERTLNRVLIESIG